MVVIGGGGGGGGAMSIIIIARSISHTELQFYTARILKAHSIQESTIAKTYQGCEDL